MKKILIYFDVIGIDIFEIISLIDFCEDLSPLILDISDIDFNEFRP